MLEIFTIIIKEKNLNKKIMKLLTDECDIDVTTLEMLVGGNGELLKLKRKL